MDQQRPHLDNPPPPAGAGSRRTQDGPTAHPQLLDHRAHRPRQVHARGQDPRADAHRGPARDARAGARLDGSRARARHHDQGAGGAGVLRERLRADLPAAPDRHARARGLHLRGVALAGRLRGRAAGGGRLPGRGGADRRQHLPRGGRGPRADPLPEQARPPRRRARAGGGRSGGADRRAAGSDPAHLRQDRRRRRGGAGAAGRPRAPARRRPRGAAPRADLRLRVRPVQRRDRLHPRGRRGVPQGRADPRDGERAARRHRRHRLLLPADDAHRPARRGRGRVPDHGREGRHAAAGRRHAHHARRRAGGSPARSGAGHARAPAPKRPRRCRGIAR